MDKIERAFKIQKDIDIRLEVQKEQDLFHQGDKLLKLQGKPLICWHYGYTERSKTNYSCCYCHRCGNLWYECPDVM